MVGAAGGVTPLGLWRSDDRLMRGGPLNILGLTQRPNGAIILRLIVAVALALLPCGLFCKYTILVCVCALLLEQNFLI